MPTATKNPLEVLARLRRLPKPPAPSKAALARLRALAASNVEPVPDEDCPDITSDPQRFRQINPPLVELSPQNAAWLANHGGSKALNKILNAYRRGRPPVSTSRRTATGTRRR